MITLSIVENKHFKVKTKISAAVSQMVLNNKKYNSVDSIKLVERVL